MRLQTRRRFLAETGAVATAAAAAPLLGLGAGGTVLAQGAQKKLGWALCGLGGLSENQIAPALQKTQICRLAGVITDTPAKASKWKAKYGIADRSVYTYDTMDKLAREPRHRRRLHRHARTRCMPSRPRSPSRPASTCSARSRWKCPSSDASR